MDAPYFTVVIVTYNYGRFLRAALDSVLAQSCQDFELIIVDGASTDGTVDILREYAPRLAWWVSEPDRGQSDAFNKGFARGRGRYFVWPKHAGHPRGPTSPRPKCRGAGCRRR